MKYRSTRNPEELVTASEAITRGISADGGLFVPESLPKYTYADLTAMQLMSYQERAAFILKDFLTDFTREEIEECVRLAYTEEKFGGETPAPLTLVPDGEGSLYFLELWHGPTCAFKDMALQLLPQLLTRSVQKADPGKTVLILTATSGDTGKAALEGFRDVDGTKIIVFYPENGVSDMQKRQMDTQEGKNVGVSAIRGNFDDAQTGVKKIFVDPAVKARLLEHNTVFSSANSINLGRLVPQIVYYFTAYCELMKTGEMDYEGEKINIVVPTGNFGNILAAYYAVKMGLPVNRLICASNENNVLTDFLNDGVYDRNRPFHTTISPSMDILISSNLERMLYDMSSAEQVREWMRQLSANGSYRVTDDVLLQMKSLFSAGFCTDAETKETIRDLFQSENYLCDPHTAVAVKVYHDYVARTGDRKTPTVLVSTASPYKFADSVLSAVKGEDAVGDDPFEMIGELAAVTGTPIPAPIAALEGKEVRFRNVCDRDDMQAMVYRLAGIE
ncbi:threonine synthase [Yeguia hominis]|uniref:Threonine synthase n=1 Tax=Yeguia hominis TaxID=2763662 RepID=A0A926HLU2_9FIRM|nr:threonine synthase [Yeguia hominis]MBC8532457.1 threonine synthase [Yeguia hominis]